MTETNLMEILTDFIWIPDWAPADGADARVVYFRKTFFLEQVPESHPIQVSANARYKLYINGAFVQEGPQKGTAESAYVDTAETAPFLNVGVNVAVAEVLYYPASPKLRNDSLYHSDNPCFYIADGLATADPGTLNVAKVSATNAEIMFGGREGWKCRRAFHIQICGEPFSPAPVHAMEDVRADRELAGWMGAGYDDENWQEARPYSVMEAHLEKSPFNMEPRTIPPMRHSNCRFREVVCVRESGTEFARQVSARWQSLLEGRGTVTIPANTVQIVEIGAGEEMCGYIHLAMRQGRDARISLTYAECYAYPTGQVRLLDGELHQTVRKGDRSDFVNGRLFGPADHYTAAGYGHAAADKLGGAGCGCAEADECGGAVSSRVGFDECDGAECYEPFWFRTFRYIQVKIETRETPLALTDLSYRSTGYPLEVKTMVRTSDASFPAIWDISLHTLERCMHETYLDCPFYEQLQYAMDSRLEILFTYAVSADDRLARQCMEAFHRTQRADGMIQASAPATQANVIPGFSIYYILEVYDHMMYFGDQALVRHHFNCIDGILEFFRCHLTEKGLVAKVGGPLFRSKYWSFVDWCKQWDETIGVPMATLVGDGSLTMESLLYLYGLQHAAELAAFIGRDDTAAEYQARADQLKQNIRDWCMGTYVSSDGKRQTLLQDGPGIEAYSAHCQIFAILTDVVDVDEGREMLETVLDDKALPQASVSFCFYLFRALEKIDRFEKLDELWDLWRRMVADHMTTCVENDTDSRSDCHAWAAPILYEIPASYLGVRPAVPGFSKVRIRPIMGHLDSACGDVITPKGLIHVAWVREDGECRLCYTLPEGCELCREQG